MNRLVTFKLPNPLFQPTQPIEQVQNRTERRVRRHVPGLLCEELEGSVLLSPLYDLGQAPLLSF